MSVVNSIRSQFAPIHPQGYPFVGGFALASLILFFLWTPLGWIGTSDRRIEVTMDMDYSAASARTLRGSGAGSLPFSSTTGGLRFGAIGSSAARASFSRASSASRCRFHMLA